MIEVPSVSMKYLYDVMISAFLHYFALAQPPDDHNSLNLVWPCGEPGIIAWNYST